MSANQPSSSGRSGLAQERRRFFRVNDLVSIRYSLIDPGAENSEQHPLLQETSAKLNQMETELSPLLEGLKSTQRDLYQVLSILNQKMNLIAGSEKSDSDDGRVLGLRNVNISACGIAFPVDEDLALNQYLAIDLTLFPSNVCLHLTAAVIACERLHDPEVDAPFILRADFVNLEEADHELLVQHVIKKQAQMLNQKLSNQE